MIHPKADGMTCSVDDRFFVNPLQSRGLTIDRMQQQQHDQRSEVSVDCCYQQWATHHHQQLPPVPSPMQQMEGEQEIRNNLCDCRHIGSHTCNTKIRDLFIHSTIH